MWILPPSLMSLCATATEESTSDSIESLVKVYEPLLFARSKVLPSKMLLRKWKQGSFLRLRSGMMLNPFRGKSFGEKWTSCLVGSLASHSQQQESVEEATIPATYSPSSSTVYEQLDLPLFSSKTSKESSVQGLEKDGEIQPELRFCSMSSESWSGWVTGQRQEYSARVKSAHRTKGSESSSSAWPTSSARDYKDSSGMSVVGVNPDGSKRNRTDQLARAVYAENWPTARVTTNGGNSNAAVRNGTSARDWVRDSRLEDWVVMVPTSGPADPANHSTHGNLPEPVEEFPIPRTTDWKSSLNAPSNPKRVEDGTATLGEFIHAGAVQQWSTPKASDPQHAGPNMRDSSGNYALPAQAVRENWSTPRSGATDSTRPNNKGGVPLADQVNRESWSTPCSRDHHPNGNVEGSKVDLGNQVSWSTPQTRDNRSGDPARREDPARSKNLNDQMGVKNAKLNPRWVETLMGLPVGWTMPSCAFPVTIELTNCDCLETEWCPQQQNEPSEPSSGGYNE